MPSFHPLMACISNSQANKLFSALHPQGAEPSKKSFNVEPKQQDKWVLK